MKAARRFQTDTGKNLFLSNNSLFWRKIISLMILLIMITGTINKSENFCRDRPNIDYEVQSWVQCPNNACFETMNQTDASEEEVSFAFMKNGEFSGNPEITAEELEAFVSKDADNALT